MHNPLLSTAPLPAFAAIRPEHLTPALDVLLPEADAALERAVGSDVPADYDALSAVLDHYHLVQGRDNLEYEGSEDQTNFRNWRALSGR